MITHEITVFARPDLDNEQGYRFIIFSPELKWYSNDTDIELETLEILTPELEHSKGELAIKAINTLREKQERKRAEAEQDCQRLQEQIDKLLLLPYIKEENESGY